MNLLMCMEKTEELTMTGTFAKDMVKESFGVNI